MATLAFAQMAYYVFHDTKVGGGSDGIYLYFRPEIAIGSVQLLDLGQPLVFYFFVFAALVLTFLLLAAAQVSRFGRTLAGISATGQDKVKKGFEPMVTGFRHVPFNDQPITHRHLRGIRSLLDGYSTRVSVGEVYLLDEEARNAYHGDGDELHLCFNFRFLWAPFDATELRSRILRTIEVLRTREAWPTWVLSNHDVTLSTVPFGSSGATSSS